MGKYSLVELSHDFCPERDHDELLNWAMAMRRYLGSGEASELPQGVRLKVRDCHPLLERVDIRPYKHSRR